MTIEEALVAYLATQDGVVQLVGGRVYPEEAPPEAGYPRVTYSVVSDVGGRHLTSAAGYSQARVQLDVWGQSGAQGYKQVSDVKEQLREALDGYRGTMGSVVVQSCWLEDQTDAAEPAQFARERGDARRVVDVFLWYEQSVPSF